MSYHSKGISKNKKIRAERKKPLPLKLMRIENEVKRVGARLSDDGKNIIYS